MKRIFFVLLVFCLSINHALALEIVYPKTKNVKINAKSTFFIGNTLEPLKINDEDVSTLKNGEFAHVVPLKFGENIFKIQTKTKTMTYKILREQLKPQPKPVFKDFPQTSFIVTTDGATLRQTPIDAGINRLSQLPSGTNLVINGENGNFYRVMLSEFECAWIAKNEVTQNESNNFSDAKFRKLHCKRDGEFEYHRFKLSKKIPFSVVNQDEKIVLKFYNTNKPFEFETDKKLGFNYYYDEHDHFVLKIRYCKQEIPTITVDAGHGGAELGAVGCNGDREKDINLKIAKYIKQNLEPDFNVVMTRENDEQLSLKKRIEIANKNNSMILISIHANALPDGENPNWHRGTSVYYYHTQAKTLAQSILKEVTEQAGTKDDKVRQRSLALTRPTLSISVLVEVAYMINPYDNIKLSNDEFQRKVAKAISDAIRNYVCAN
ncbi:N-acetylmuramoyl-L-alanine amidase [bacterium]|nr:N-acetylmuramoyl-L-alanine amidase [bacterium]